LLLPADACLVTNASCPLSSSRALLGADEFGFGTVAMIAVGCVMARICHTNNCPVGVTTQKEALREKFVGVPNDMLGFFLYVSEETRQVITHTHR